MSEIDRPLEEAWRTGSGDAQGRQLLRGYAIQLAELKGAISEGEAFIRGMLRDRQVDFGDLPPKEEAGGDFLFQCIHSAHEDVLRAKSALIAYYTDKRGGV